MQEIHALDLEVKRLKEVKAMYKEYRRYVEMPSKLLEIIIVSLLSRCDVPSMSLLPGLEQEEAPL